MRTLQLRPCWRAKFKTVQRLDEEGQPYDALVEDGGCFEMVVQGTLAPAPDQRKLLISALRLGCETGIRLPLVRLAAHKTWASHADQMTLLLADYVNDLAEYPEWVVVSVCDYYRREVVSRFMPSVAEMRQACRALTDTLARALRQSVSPPVALINAPERWTPPSDEEKQRSLAWMDYAKTKVLSDDEFEAWQRGEMPPGTVRRFN